MPRRKLQLRLVCRRNRLLLLGALAKASTYTVMFSGWSLANLTFGQEKSLNLAPQLTNSFKSRMKNAVAPEPGADLAV